MGEKVDAGRKAKNGNGCHEVSHAPEIGALPEEINARKQQEPGMVDEGASAVRL